MGYKTITQIILTVIALIIIFTYIKPTLISISDVQDKIATYALASQQATKLNEKLAELVGVEQSFRTSDIDSLQAYLPNSIDDLMVMADLSVMAEQSSIHITSMSADELVLPNEDSFFEGELLKTDKTISQDFSLQLNGSYESLKLFMQSIAENNYPLEVISLSFGSFKTEDVPNVTRGINGLEGTYDLILRTYAYSYTKTSN